MRRRIHVGGGSMVPSRTRQASPEPESDGVYPYYGLHDTERGAEEPPLVEPFAFDQTALRCRRHALVQPKARNAPSPASPPDWVG